MIIIDWIVLFGTIFFIVAYGVWKSRGQTSMESYLLGGKESKWITIGLSIMATQASAITFLSTTGQGYDVGMRFVQFYLGLPIAMIILSAFVLPLYYKMRVYTAYEYLEGRFNKSTRILAAVLFLMQRGLAAGITIYAPAIILSKILGWPLEVNNLLIGILVIIYTMSGGTKAVSQTQKQQMAVMMGGMVLAGIFVLLLLPEDVSASDAVYTAGQMGKMELLTFEFDLNDRYNVWTGLLASVFLFLSYFGTDQSQVQRYLSGKSLKESRMGLMFNGLLKVPMQFLILFIGVLVFVFFQFEKPPLFFNQTALDAIENTEYRVAYDSLDAQYEQLFEAKQQVIRQMLDAKDAGNTAAAMQYKQEALQLTEQHTVLRDSAKAIIRAADPDLETKDTDYIFISYVMDYLPHGLIGLLLAVIFSAAMSSTAGELNALASTTVVDIYKRNFKQDGTERHYLIMSRLFTLFWGVFAILFATFATLLDNLVEAVNILGSLFYGAILGIFLCGFFLKFIKGSAVFIAGILAEIVVLGVYFGTKDTAYEIGYLWYNLIGTGLVVILALILQSIMPGKQTESA